MICIMLSLILIIAVSGCNIQQNVDGISNPQITQGADNPQKTDKTKISVWVSSATPERNQFFEEAIKQFHDENPDIEVDHLGVPGALKQKYDVAVAAGSEPDCGNSIDQDVSLITRGAMHPLDEYFNNWDKKDQIMPAAIQSARNMDFKENKMYMLPVGTLVSLMWVRPDWFAEKNLDIPEDWDQMFDAIEKLTDKSQGRYGLSIRGGGGSAMNLEYLMYSYSGISEYFTEDGKCTINDPLHVEFVEKYLGQYNVNTPEDDLNKGWTELAATFQSGKAAVIGHNLGSASSHAKTFDNDYSKFQAVNFPKSKQGYRVQPQLVIHSYGIFENSKNKDVAWKFITFLASKEQNSELTKLYGEVPANKEASEDSWVQELPYMKTGTELINSSDTKYYKQPVYMPGYVNTLSSDIEPMVQMVMAKEMTAQEMCDEWARLMEQVKIDFDASN